MKGITPIIAIIVLLLIVVALAGLAYTYLFSTMTVYTENTIQHVFGSQQESSVIIQNLGSSTLTAQDITVTVNGQPATLVNFQPLGAREASLMRIDSSVAGNGLRVTFSTPASTIQYRVSITEEVCTDRQDNNLNTLQDCADAQCLDGMDCAVGGLGGAACNSVYCNETNCLLVSPDEDTDGDANCDDTDCLGELCDPPDGFCNSGTCVYG